MKCLFHGDLCWLNKIDYRSDEEQMERLRRFDRARKIEVTSWVCEDVADQIDFPNLADTGGAGVCVHAEHIKGIIHLANAITPGSATEWSGYIDRDGMMRTKILLSGVVGNAPLTPKMGEKVVLFHTHPLSSKYLQPSRSDWAFYIAASSHWGWRNHILASQDQAILMQFPIIHNGWRVEDNKHSDSDVARYISRIESQGPEGESYIDKVSRTVEAIGGNVMVLGPEIYRTVVFYDEGPGADAKEEELERYVCPNCRWGGLFRGTTMVHHIDSDGNIREFDRTDTWIQMMEQKICPIHNMKLERVWFRQETFYHASSDPDLPEILEPQGHFEAINEYGELECWQPDPQEPPFCHESDVPESAFAMTPGGAVLGHFSVSRDGGTFHIYATEEEPDIDMSDNFSAWHDFNVIEEVRYRRPVRIRKVCTVTVSDDMAVRLNEPYIPCDQLHPPNKDMMRDLVSELNQMVTCE